MGADLHAILSRDHERLDTIIERACGAKGPSIPPAMKICAAGCSGISASRSGSSFGGAKTRRRHGSRRAAPRDHAALSALLVLPPDHAEIKVIRGILDFHNPLEEEGGGLYEQVEDLTGDDLATIVARLIAYPPVRLAAHADTPLVRRTIEQLVGDAEAGRRALRERSRQIIL